MSVPFLVLVGVGGFSQSNVSNGSRASGCEPMRPEERGDVEKGGGGGAKGFP